MKRSRKGKRSKRVGMAALSLIVLIAAVVTSAASARPEAGSLKIYALAGDRIPMEAVLKVWKRQNPSVKTTITYADTAPYQSTLRTQLAAGTAADVFEVWPGNGNPGAIQVLAPFKYLADLSNQPFAKLEPKGIRNVTHVGGKLYFVPPAYSGIGAIYNMDTLAKLGVSPPNTWSEVLALCTKAKAAGMAAYSLGNQDQWVTQLIPYALVPTLVYRLQPNWEKLAAKGKRSFSKSGWVTAEQKYLDMNERGCFQKGVLSTNYTTSVPLVSNNQAVAIVQGSWAFAPLRDANSNPTYKMFPFPATDNAAQTWMPGAANAGFAMNAKTKNPIALKFINFVASPAFQNTFATTQGSLPAYPNSRYKVDPGLVEFVKFQKTGKTYPFPDQLWPNPKVQAAHLTGLQDLFAGKGSIAEMLAAMDKAYREK